MQPPYSGPPACGTCQAPLQPGAFQCPYCGTATPLGLQAAAQQAQQQLQLAAQQRQAETVVATRKRLINLQTAQSSAKSALILAAVGLPICCGPLSIVGGVMGVRAIKLAKTEGVAAPAQAFFAIVLAFLSTGLFVTAIVMGLVDSHDRSERLAGLDKALAGKREAAGLETKAACDLAEERVLEDGTQGHTTLPDSFACDGPLEVHGDRAMLRGVHVAYSTADKYVLTACLAKRGAWFVLELGKDADCTAAAPPMPAGVPPKTEADKRALEKRLREAYAAGKSKAALDAFIARLSTIKQQTANVADLRETACPRDAIRKRLPSPDARLKVPAVDFDELDRRAAPAAGHEPWSWMTSDDIRTLLAPDTPADKKATTLKTLHEESGGYLVVYRAVAKHWFVVKEKEAILGKKIAFAPGDYDGWLVVFDADIGTRLCATRLAWESGDDITYDKHGISSEKDRAEDAVEDDFRSHFEDAATAAIKKAAPDLRLGYKVLE